MAAVLPAFVLATLLLAMLPGPATALLIREAVTGDRRRVVGVLAGIEVGIFAWAVFSGLGVAALVAASTLAYAVLKAVGATVLVVLGIQTLWNARKGAPAAKARKVPGLRGFRGGVLTLASVVRTVRRFFDRSSVKRRLERVVGAVLVALGLRLAVD